MIQWRVSVISIKFIALLGNGLISLLSSHLSFSGEKFSSEFSCICSLKGNELEKDFGSYGRDYNYYNFYNFIYFLLTYDFSNFISYLFNIEKII